jgi:hypothetical protein
LAQLPKRSSAKAIQQWVYPIPQPAPIAQVDFFCLFRPSRRRLNAGGSAVRRRNARSSRPAHWDHSSWWPKLMLGDDTHKDVNRRRTHEDRLRAPGERKRQIHTQIPRLTVWTNLLMDDCEGIAAVITPTDLIINVHVGTYCPSVRIRCGHNAPLHAHRVARTSALMSPGRNKSDHCSPITRRVAMYAFARDCSCSRFHRTSECLAKLADAARRQHRHLEPLAVREPG